MENTVVSRVDQPGVSAVSTTGAFVAAFFLTWLALIVVLGARVCSSRRGGRRRLRY
jgi:hypothetical protein